MAIPITEVLSHWSHFFQSFALSSESFYNELSGILRSHDMPNSKIEKVKHKEAGMFSSEREYLRIKHGNLVFDVCAAPFGKDFFISWWLYETEGTVQNVLKNTKVGSFLKQQSSKRTFYQVDEEDMFRSCVHECILESVSKVTEGKGFRELSDKEKAYTPGGM
jgi:hypothetical protein